MPFSDQGSGLSTVSLSLHVTLAKFMTVIFSVEHETAGMGVGT